MTVDIIRSVFAQLWQQRFADHRDCKVFQHICRLFCRILRNSKLTM